MKHLRILLLATVATGGVLAAFASGAGPLGRLSNAAAGVTGANAPLVLVDDDEDEDEGGYFQWKKSGHGHDRHDGGHHGDDDDDDGEDDDDDDGQRQGGRNNPGQVGTTMPPKNGLILEGSAPKVQVN